MRGVLPLWVQNWSSVPAQVELCWCTPVDLAYFKDKQTFSEADSVPRARGYRKDHKLFLIQGLCFSMTSVQISAMP